MKSRTKISRWSISAALFFCGTTAFSSARAQTTGTLSAIYEFTGGADGEEPLGGLVRDSAGNLYGTTRHGGSTTCTAKAGQPKQGCGTLYRFNKSTGLTVLVSFTGAKGAYGENTLTLSGTTLYGTTDDGGVNDDGIVFSVNTDGTGFTILHQFAGTDGRHPTQALQLGAGGILYGVTAGGGAYNHGALFSLTTNGTYTDLHDFSGSTADGADPFSLFTAPDGTLVGSTSSGGVRSRDCTGGCGAVFAYAPSTQTYFLPFLFSPTTGFTGPIGSIAPGPTLYGANFSYVFALNETTGFTSVATINQSESGGIPSGPLRTRNGTLVGVIGPGNVQFGGELYSVANGVLSVVLFGTTTGASPVAQPLLMPNGEVLGTASTEGLCADCGTIWAYTP